MQKELQVFTNKDFGEVRVLEIDGQVWFVGKDVTKILGYENGSRDLNRHVDDDDRQNYRNGTSEINNRGVTIINESGLPDEQVLYDAYREMRRGANHRQYAKRKAVADLPEAVNQ